MKKNQGYTLVEMLIVIAIIVIMSGMSFVTIGIIKEAKCNAAASTLNDQTGALLTKTRAISQATGDKLVLQIRKNDNRIDFADNTVARAGSYSLILGTYNGTTFTAKNVDSDGNDVPEAILPEFIEIYYMSSADAKKAKAETDESKKPKSQLINDKVYIEYNKSNGSVAGGAGEYEIRYNGVTKATMYLDEATGNHYVK